MRVWIPKHLVQTIEKYRDTDWTRDASKIGALNAVAYIGEQIVGVYAAAKLPRKRSPR